MSSEEENKLYLEGIRLFNQHEYFEAHEVWEDLWRISTGLKRQYFQGLIQCAVALEHYRRSNPHGVVALHRSYQSRLRDVPRFFMGLNLTAFLAKMEETLSPVLAANPLPAKGEVHIDYALTPQIQLQSTDGEPT